tara:strand:+ start:22000 stop:22179 length:180 start_codon:yes stop_codon:yes gene_type:complete
MSSTVAEPPTSSTNNQEIELSIVELSLVRWEELALALEEHYHALDLWNKRPDGLPMGHR